MDHVGGCRFSFYVFTLVTPLRLSASATHTGTGTGRDTSGGTAGRRWSCPRVAALFALCCVGVFVWQIVRFALKTRQNGRKTGVFGRIMPRNRAILRVLDLNFACFKTFFALKSKFFECWTTPKTAVHLHQMPKKQNPHQKKHLTRVKGGGVWVLALPFPD